MSWRVTAPDFGEDATRLLAQLCSIVGARNVLADSKRTLRHRRGFRSGEGDALAVVFPTTLLQQWQVLQACSAAGTAIIMQAANTGLTEGSTPGGDFSHYGRALVIVNTLLMRSIHLLHGGRQALCFAGATLHGLERALKPLGREPHSEIGSSCIGATVVGGICNNSGGMLVRRGPAYTELALYARFDASGRLQLVNHLGIRLGDTPEVILARLDKEDFGDADVEPVSFGQASSADYQDRVRDVDASTPARYNNDSTRLYETSGSGGKLAVFAVRVDTFEADERTQVLCVGVRDPAQLTRLRQALLSPGRELPVACEYMHRDIFDLSSRYAKDSFAAIDRFGTEAMPHLYSWKARLDSMLSGFKWVPDHPSDRIAQLFARLLPPHVPPRLRALRDQYEHLLLLKTCGPGIEQAQSLLAEQFSDPADGRWFACTQDEGDKAFLHRFVAGGAAIRYKIMKGKSVEGVFSLDFALPRDTEDWVESLPEAISEQLAGRYRYAHFLCHVFHHDYVVKKGANLDEVKEAVLKLIAARGGEYPAEHNVGHVYPAKPALAGFYRALDPTNTFNPGLGGMSKQRFYASEA